MVALVDDNDRRSLLDAPMMSSNAAEQLTAQLLRDVGDIDLRVKALLARFGS